jgi:hypothetical protein
VPPGLDEPMTRAFSGEAARNGAIAACQQGACLKRRGQQIASVKGARHSAAARQTLPWAQAVMTQARVDAE